MNNFYFLLVCSSAFFHCCFVSKMNMYYVCNKSYLSEDVHVVLQI